MRDSFIIHAMIDFCLLEVLYCNLPRHLSANNKDRAARDSPPQIKTIGVGFQLPFRKAHFVVHMLLLQD